MQILKVTDEAFRQYGKVIKKRIRLMPAVWVISRVNRKKESRRKLKKIRATV